MAAFLDRVLACFGTSVELLTDQRREFLGAFKEMCTKALIDHYTTSRDHPEADGLAKRVFGNQTWLEKVWITSGEPPRLGPYVCLGFLWVINLLCMPLWRPTTRISCFMA